MDDVAARRHVQQLAFHHVRMLQVRILPALSFRSRQQLRHCFEGSNGEFRCGVWVRAASEIGKLAP